jgi:hypothetical protein
LMAPRATGISKTLEYYSQSRPVCDDTILNPP